MKYHFLVFVAIAISACTSSRIVNHIPSTGSLTYAQMNETLIGEEALITLTNGHELRGKEIRIRSDSTSWVYADTRENHITSISKIAKIASSKHGQGAIEELGLCCLAGAVGGLVVGILFTKEGEGDYFGRGFEKQIAAGVGGFVGILTDTTIGAIGDHTDEYYFNDDSTTSSSKTTDQ